MWCIPMPAGFIVAASLVKFAPKRFFYYIPSCVNIAWALRVPWGPYAKGGALRVGPQGEGGHDRGLC